MMKVSLLLQAVNRVTRPINEAVRSIERLGAVAAAVSRRVGGAMMSMYDRTRDAAYHFRKLAGEDGMARASRSAAYLKRQVSGLTTGLSILKYATVAGAIGLTGEFVRGVFQAGGEMQRMQVTLTRLEGSATKARAAMSWIQSFAMGAGANFAMPDILRAYQMAQNFGMHPQGGSLAAFADLAAGERVPLRQVLYAVKDAMEGTSVRPLANLGIKMRQDRHPGGQNHYLYADASGHFIRMTSARTPEATLAAVVKIIESKYMGLATAQAKTLPGGLEQLRKLLYLFEMKVATSGVFDWALQQLNRFFAWVRKASADGSLDRLAKRISDFMVSVGNKLIAFVRGTDWSAVATDLKAFGSAIAAVAGAIGLLAKIGGGGLSGLLNLFVASKIIGITTALAGFAEVIGAVTAMLVGVEIAAAPIEATIIIIGLLAGAAYLLWANWDGISKWWHRLWTGMPAWLKTAVSGVVAVLSPLVSFPIQIIENWSRITGFFKRLWNSLPKPPRWLTIVGGVITGNSAIVGSAIGAPRPGPPRQPSRSPQPAHPPARGKLTIELTGDKASAGQVRHLRATGMDLEVRRGLVGAGG